MKTPSIVWALTAAVLAASLTIVLPSKQASASTQFSQQTGKACNYCHSAPPALNNRGKAFKAKGNKL